MHDYPCCCAHSATCDTVSRRMAAAPVHEQVVFLSVVLDLLPRAVTTRTAGNEAAIVPTKIPPRPARLQNQAPLVGQATRKISQLLVEKLAKRLYAALFIEPVAGFRRATFSGNLY